MEPTPSQEGERSPGRPGSDLSREGLPRPPEPAEPRGAGDDAASSPAVARGPARRLATREKRSRRAAGNRAERLSRDGVLARLWHAAAADDPRVAPRVREHFRRCVRACLANGFGRYLM